MWLVDFPRHRDNNAQRPENRRDGLLLKVLVMKEGWLVFGVRGWDDL